MARRDSKKLIIRVAPKAAREPESPEEVKACQDGMIMAMLTAVSIDRQIPLHMLLGQPKQDATTLSEQDKADRVIRITVKLPPAIHRVEFVVDPK